MKVWQLKAINEFVQEKKLRIDYKELIKYSEKDIELIIEEIGKVNENVEVLLKFFSWIDNNPEEINVFDQLLEEEFDIKTFIIEKIINAKSLIEAESIYMGFDMNSLANLNEIFKNIDEWILYINSISDCTSDTKVGIIADNLYILTKFEDEKTRKEIIKKVMKYSQTKYAIKIRGIFNNELFNYANDILDLLIKGYDPNEVRNFFENYDIREEYVDKKMTLEHLNQIYNEALSFLKNNELFNPEKDDTTLLAIFNDYCLRDYSELLYLFKILDRNNFVDLYEKVLDRTDDLHNLEIVNYLAIVCKYRDDGYDFFYESAIRIWENDVLANYSEEDFINLLEILKSLEKASVCSSAMFTDLICKIKNIDLFTKMKITTDNLRNIDEIFISLPEILSNNIRDDKLILNKIEEEYYADLIGDLSKIDFDICFKIFRILTLQTVKAYDIQDKINLKNILLNPENYVSLNYIYEELQEKKIEYNNHEDNIERKNKETQPVTKMQPNSEPIKFQNVLELISEGFDIEKVLEGFKDDDEITSKTLVRSRAYKNNQN